MKVVKVTTDNKDSVCEVVCFNEQLVSKLKTKIQKIDGLSEIFKVLSDETRLKILYALSGEELCVCDIANTVGLSLPAVSHHLRILRNLKLVKHYKESRMVYYTLNDHHVANLIEVALEHLNESK
jgi:DNA-binding transcriptional ArsR family regulator